MAGKRFTDNNSITADNPILFDDYLVIGNTVEDRKISYAELTRILHSGVDFDGAVRFVSVEDLKEISEPENAAYRFHDGKIQFLNVDDEQWYTLSICTSGGRTLKWATLAGAEIRAVSVDSNGVIVEPPNFVKANKIVTADGGQLSKLKAGKGIIGDDYNGSGEKTWDLDEVYLTKFIGKATESAKIIRADSGELVALKCRIVAGVPQFYGEIINEQ